MPLPFRQIVILAAPSCEGAAGRLLGDVNFLAQVDFLVAIDIAEEIRLKSPPQRFADLSRIGNQRRGDGTVQAVHKKICFVLPAVNHRPLDFEDPSVLYGSRWVLCDHVHASFFELRGFCLLADRRLLEPVGQPGVAIIFFVVMDAVGNYFAGTNDGDVLLAPGNCGVQ